MKSRAKSHPKKSSSQVPKSKKSSALSIFDTVVKEGDLITFDPTGEQLKIAKIEGETITIEKLP